MGGGTQPMNTQVSPTDNINYKPVGLNYTPQQHAVSMQADGNTTGFRSQVPQALGSPPQNDVPLVSAPPSVLDTGGPTDGRVMPEGYGVPEEPDSLVGGVAWDARYGEPIAPGGGYSNQAEPIAPGGGYDNVQWFSSGGLVKDPLEGYDFKRGR